MPTLAVHREKGNRPARPVLVAVEPAPAWQPSVYAPPPGHRRQALAMTALIFAVVITSLFIELNRTGFTASKPAAPLVVSLMPLASPPQRKREKDKPVPEKKREKQVTKPKVDPAPRPIVPLPSNLTAPPPVPQAPAPTPAPKPIEDAAPKAVPAPPAPQVSSNAVDNSWQAQVLARLGKYRRYPFGAQSRHEQGVPYIRFVMDRGGKILSSDLERSSGFSDLDREALSLPKRAQPLPRPPADVKGDTIELVVPIEFFIH